MCIICNVDENTTHEAIGFLHHYGRAQAEMKRAADSLLSVSKTVSDQEIARQYDRTHKRMVRILREWNSLEHSREVLECGATTALPEQQEG
jgi:hypothetical protein